MSVTQVSRQINAPVSKVFEVISDPEQFLAAVPHITHIEVLTDQRTGVGARFRETRLINGREMKSTLEVKELIANERIRLDSDEGGTKWLSTLTTEAVDERCKLTLTMEAKAYKLIAKLVNPFFKGMIRKAIEADLDAIKTYCETR